MMRTLEIYMAIKPFFSVTANHCATQNNPFWAWKQCCTFFFTDGPEDSGAYLPEFLACEASHTATS